MFPSDTGFLDNDFSAINCVSRVFSSISAFTESPVTQYHLYPEQNIGRFLLSLVSIYCLCYFPLFWVL